MRIKKGERKREREKETRKIMSFIEQIIKEA